MRSRSFKKAVSLVILLSVFVTGIHAQSRRPGLSSKSACSGAWTGNVTYSRRQTMSDHKVTQRVSNRGKDTRDWEMKYDYKASVAVLESPEKDGSNIGKARIEHSFTTTETVLAQEENSCDRGKSFQVMTGNFVSKSVATGNASNVEASIGVGVNSDGTYSVSVGLPQIRGMVSGSETSQFAGQCQPKEGKNVTMPSTATNIDGNSMTTDGSHRINPSDPNRISGSWSQTNLGVTETISWTLEKCGAPLRISDLQFEDMKFPNWNDWQEIVEQRGTIDGNLVKIKAKILNTSGETKFADLRLKETYKGDKWDGARPDAPLQDQVLSVRVDANSEETVEMVWDSSGYAWFDDGRPRLLQRIKAELEENDKKIDELTKNLKIAPKPVVLVHGLWSNWKAWESWQNILTTVHSYDWKAFPVGEKSEKGVMNTGKEFMSSEQTASIGDNARQLESYVRYAQEDRNAWHVDIVAHSMGGLISRYYISQIMEANSPDGRPKVSHLIMLGTPNMGSPCADVMDIAFGMVGKSVEAVRQLTPGYVSGFNRINTQRKGVKFSALAGNPLPTMCKEIVANDGVVSVPSAKWIVKDTAESGNIHTDLTGTSDFSSFVKPRLAIGPKGNHDPEIPTTSSRMQNSEAGLVNVAYRPDTLANVITSSDIDFARAVKIAPKQSVEIEIPVAEAMNFGLTFMAVPDVSASLIDDKSTVVGKNLAKTPEASGWFRSIFFDRPTSTGTWKLRLENTSEFSAEIVLATWKRSL
ncbi:MAG: alpha/beta hydrolase [Acidobacteria bacterium]|nr:alpha/beta hydrolase [Acidobacteriota bacterium]